MNTASSLLNRKEESPCFSGRASAPGHAEVRPANESTLSVEQWADQIRRVWARSATNTLELARIVGRARQTMRYGTWAQLWRSRPMPFSKRKADMLVAIGQRLGDLAEQTFAHLPTGWSTLYQLAQLSRETLERLVQAGTVHPGLTLREAKELKFHGRPRPARSSEVRVRQRVKQFGEFVHRTLSEWPPADRKWARAELVRLIGQIESLPESESLRDILPRAIIPILAINKSSSVMRGVSKHIL